MSFEEFQDYIRENILIGWMPQAEVKLQEIKKNNGVVCCGLYIKEKGEKVSPYIYLEDYYAAFCSGDALETILEKIRSEYLWGMDHLASRPVELADFSKVKDAIIYRLVNYEKNREILLQCPFIQMNDLAVTFRWVAHMDEIGISTALISNRELMVWGISLPELLLTAEKNTSRLFPARIMSLEEVAGEQDIVEEKIVKKKESSIYVLTNSCRINGATAILYDKILKEFAAGIQDDFYILPSSIHEMLLIPAAECHEDERLAELVREANESFLSPGDVLSDSVYYYDRKRDSVICLPPGGRE